MAEAVTSAHHLFSELSPSSSPSSSSSSASAQLVFKPFVFTAPTIPSAFIWPEAIQSHMSMLMKEQQTMEVPTIDLAKFRVNTSTLNNIVALQEVAQAAAQASMDIGFFNVVNHGVPQALIEAAHGRTQSFFDLSLPTKQKASRLLGESFGYASSFTGRFSSRLPWKETFSLQPSPVSNIPTLFEKVLGDQHEESSLVYEKYSEAMIKLGLEIIELLSLGLGLKRSALRRFFDENSSILRLNYYPPCQQPSLTYGTGPHTDPTGLTILHQDDVSGLQVLHNGDWYTVSPRKDAFVVNIGDTLMALTNERYKSCVHRALVNSKEARRSMAFFFNPGFDTVLSSPDELIDEANPRAYREFTWAKFLFFTQSIHRSEVNTLRHFNNWLGGAAHET